MNFCTLSDRNYLYKGLALYHSLKSIAGGINFTLYYLAMDAETYNILHRLQEKGFSIVPIHINHLIENDSQLANAQDNPPRNYGTTHGQFCWTCTPYFIWWLLKNKIKVNDSLLYMDADLYFYHNPAMIIDECAGKVVGVHQHRNLLVGEPYDINNPTGEFNVGCVYFANTQKGVEIAEWWKNCLISTDHEWYEKYGTCGDQKYLDLFIPMFGNDAVHIFDKSFIGHGAPWNFNHYKYFSNNNMIEYRGVRQHLLFNHFSHFTSDFEHGKYSSSTKGEWNPEEVNPMVRHWYEKYWEEIKAAKQLVENAF